MFSAICDDCDNRRVRVYLPSSVVYLIALKDIRPKCNEENNKEARYDKDVQSELHFLEGTDSGTYGTTVNLLDDCGYMAGSMLMLVNLIESVKAHGVGRRGVLFSSLNECGECFISGLDVNALCSALDACADCSYKFEGVDSNCREMMCTRCSDKDFIIANPPFNIKRWRGESELIGDKRFVGFTMPPVSNANYAWILHMLSELEQNNGIAVFLLANGALISDGVEGEIRKELIEKDKVEAIIVLPRDIFYNVDQSCTLWVVNNNKKACDCGECESAPFRDRVNEVLFVDLRTWNDNVEEFELGKNKKKKKIVFTSEQIFKIKSLYDNWQSADCKQSVDCKVYADVPEYCKSVHKDDIMKSDGTIEYGLKSHKYSLAPSKYIEFIDHDLEIDYESEMARIQTEMKEILIAEKKSQIMLEEAFRGIGYGIE